MKKQMGSSVLRLLFVVLLPVALPLGCNKSEGPGPAEKAGKVVDKAAVEATDAVREGAKKVATATEDAAVKTGEAIERGAEKASDAAKDAAHKTADAINTAVPTPKKK